MMSAFVRWFVWNPTRLFSGSLPDEPSMNLPGVEVAIYAVELLENQLGGSLRGGVESVAFDDQQRFVIPSGYGGCFPSENIVVAVSAPLRHDGRSPPPRGVRSSTAMTDQSLPLLRPPTSTATT